MRVRIALIAMVFILIGLLIYAAMTPKTAYAHGSGVTFTATTSTYLIDVDYSDFFIRAGESGRFDLRLFADAARKKSVDFSRVWVRVVQKSDLPEGETIFSGWLSRPDFGPAGFTISLPEPGRYDLILRYVKDDKTISDTTFHLDVIEGWESQDTFLNTYGTGSLVTVAAVGVMIGAFLFIRRRRR